MTKIYGCHKVFQSFHWVWALRLIPKAILYFEFLVTKFHQNLCLLACSLLVPYLPHPPIYLIVEVISGRKMTC